MSNKFHIPLQTFTVPITEKNKYISATNILQNPVSLLQDHLMKGCIEKATAAIE